MPTVFYPSKSYLFLVFIVMGGRSLMLCMREIGWGGEAGAAATAAAAAAATVAPG